MSRLRRLAVMSAAVVSVGAVGTVATAQEAAPTTPVDPAPIVPEVPTPTAPGSTAPVAPTVPTTPTRPTAPRLPAGIIAAGVRIAGVDVGGLSRREAKVKVLAEKVAPRRSRIVVTFRGVRIPVEPVKMGYVADVDYALRGALLFGRGKTVPARGVNVPLRERVSTDRITGFLNQTARRYNVAARDAAFSLRGTTPVSRDATPGVALNVPSATRVLRTALLTRTRTTYTLPSQRVQAAVTRLPSAIIIDRAKFRLTLWKHRGKSQTWPVAVGTSSHPTPVGNFRVVMKQVNPTWFPPNSPWAAGLGPVPPGPGNPLGTRWIGTSAPAIGIHGTPVPSSIGTRASHGCIRMYIRDVERLYSQVDYEMPVYIR